MSKKRARAEGTDCNTGERNAYGSTKRQPDSLDGIIEQREKRRLFRIPRKEFTRRQRYRNSDGTVFAPALASDALYQLLHRHNLVDQLDESDESRAQRDPCAARGLPKPSSRSAVDQNGTSGTLYGNVMFFAELPADGRVHRWPSGDVEFIDPETQRVFSATVSRAVFEGKSKGGYVVLRDVVDWGAISDPRDFRK